MKEPLQSSTAPAQEPDRDRDVAHQVSQLRDRPWLTPAQTLTYLQIGSLSALYRLIKEQRLPFGRVGRKYRFSPQQLDRWIESKGTVLRESWAKTGTRG